MSTLDDAAARRPASTAGSVLLCGTGQFESEMLRRALQRAGFRVSYAHDVDAAVLAVLAGGLDAVVLGEAMPPAPRAALVRWIRGTAGVEATPIVLLSDDPDPAAAIHAYDCGVDMVVSKPVDVDLLGRKLAAVIRRSGASRRRADGA